MQFVLSVDAIKLEEAAAEKRYFDRLIRDGRCPEFIGYVITFCCIAVSALCYIFISAWSVS